MFLNRIRVLQLHDISVFSANVIGANLEKKINKQNMYLYVIIYCINDIYIFACKLCNN